MFGPRSVAHADRSDEHRSVTRLFPVVAVLPLLFGASGGSAVRPPTHAERARIVRAVHEMWEYESAPEYGELGRRRHPGRPRLRPKAVRVVVARADPRFSSAVVELRDPRGRRRGPASVMVFERIDNDKWSLKEFGAWDIAGPAISFPGACTAATPTGIRTLMCPD